MIHAVMCDNANFKKVELKSGFNVILAERTKESTKKDSRNGLGKTTLLEVIHFCLGARVQKNEGLLRSPLLGWTFSLDIDLKGYRYIISRNTEKPNRILLSNSDPKWPIQPRLDSKTGEVFMPIADWNKLLGWLMFDLDIEVDEEQYAPTFRSLISYFVRKGRDAFSSPFEHFRKQLEWDKQVNNAFLLGLAWEHAQKWQLLKDKGKTIDELKKAAKLGFMSKFLGNIGELESSKVRLEEKVKEEEKQLNSFKVHPQYLEIREKANSLTKEIHKHNNDNIQDQRLLEFYKDSFQTEQPANEENVTQLYEEVGVILPSHITKRLEEVKEFHRRVVSNRKDFLQNEIERLKRQIADREMLIKPLTDERASLMSVLQTHGALEEYNKLQQMHLNTVSQLNDIKAKIENLSKFEKGKTSLHIELEQLYLDARADYEERSTNRQKAISIFNANSEALYKAPGKLIIDIEKTGFKFDVKIERAGSQGIDQMKVFCYDLMLAQLWASKTTSPRFLIHDSTIFDGVDERQIAHALQLAAQKSETYKFQYICCLNTDMLPVKDFTEDFDIYKFNRLTLSDIDKKGGLLGIRVEDCTNNSP